VTRNKEIAQMKLKPTIALIAALACLAAVLPGAAAAASCPADGAAKVFSRWGDQRDYVLAPEGGFESDGAGWSLASGAAVVEGNESYSLNGSSDHRSLSLPSGSTAVSPPVCMAIDTPVFRMMARNGGDPTSQLRVTATYKLLGLLRTQTIATVKAGSAWAPTAPQSTVLTLSTIVGTLIPSAIQIRLQPLDNRGQWQVDDLYVDPWARR
jgi:hypothetical protein